MVLAGTDRNLLVLHGLLCKGYISSSTLRRLDYKGRCSRGGLVPRAVPPLSWTRCMVGWALCCWRRFLLFQLTVWGVSAKLEALFWVSSKGVKNSVDMGLGCAVESWSLAQKVWFAC